LLTAVTNRAAPGWQEFGFVRIRPRCPQTKGAKNRQHLSNFSLTNFRNKYRPTDVQASSSGSFATGEGDYMDGEMIFPTESMFIMQGMMPRHTMLDFTPSKE